MEMWLLVIIIIIITIFLTLDSNSWGKKIKLSKMYNSIVHPPGGCLQ